MTSGNSRTPSGISPPSQDSIQERPEDVRHELADVFLGVLRMADVAGIDIVEASREKLALNAERYPPGPELGPDGKK